AWGGTLHPSDVEKLLWKKSPKQPEQGSQNKPLRLLLVPWMRNARHHSRHKSDDDGPKNTHALSPFSGAQLAPDRNDFQLPKAKVLLEAKMIGFGAAMKESLVGRPL